MFIFYLFIHLFIHINLFIVQILKNVHWIIDKRLKFGKEAKSLLNKLLMVQFTSICQNEQNHSP